MRLPKVVIVEMGCQFTLLIQRRLADRGIRSAVLDPDKASKWFATNPVEAIILSGGSASVYDENAPQPPKGIWSLEHNGQPVPVLGICYGMQAIAQEFGGKVEPATDHREYGKAWIRLSEDHESILFDGTPLKQGVWASHGDSVTEVPFGFTVIARSSTGGVAAMHNRERNIYCVQFHPEVAHTEYGGAILGNFISKIAKCVPDWEPADMIEDIREDVLSQLGDNSAMLGFSGGVDSTTEAAILSTVLGDRLLGVTLDGGNLRENELAEIHLHAQAARLQWKAINAQRDFGHIADTIDAEEKRARFKQTYSRLLVKEAKNFGGDKVVLIQGTLAPDRIESGTTGGAKIKSHHNVGLDTGNIRQIHPLGHLFKYEVRKLAQELGLPKSVWSRQPFPGPGLFLRVVGIPATLERMSLVAWADARVTEILKRHKYNDEMSYYDNISQLVVGLVGVNTVGVKGSGRAYGPSIIVRAIQTIDFMTGRGVRFPAEVKNEIEAILCQSRDIIRVWYDEMDKPPATVELE